MIRAIGIAALAFAAAACATAAWKGGTSRPLDELLAMLPGIYTGKVVLPGAAEKGKQTIEHKIARIDAPQIAAIVFYYQLSAEGTALQQKLFILQRRPRSKTVRMRALFIPRGRIAADLERRPDDWRAIDPGQLMSFPRHCDFIWRAEGDGFTGRVRREDCRYDSPAFGQTIEAEMRYRVSADTFEWSETLFGEAGPLFSTNGALTADRQ